MGRAAADRVNALFPRLSDELAVKGLVATIVRVGLGDSACGLPHCIVGILGSVAAVSPALAQTPSLPAPTAVDAVVDFDIAGGKFTRLEHEAASSRIRSGAGFLHVRFQIEKPYFDETWLPILGFSLLDESGDNAIQIDFAELPVSEHMIMVGERVTRSTRTSEALMKIHVPGFKHGDVHSFDLAIAQDAVELIINGYRRSLKRDFDVHSIVVRPSGVKGWVAFPRPGAV